MAYLQNRIENGILHGLYQAFVTLRRPREPEESRIDMSRFELVFEDDFSAPTLDRTRWQPRFEGMRKGGFWSMDQVFLLDGQLHIRTEYKKDGPFGEGYYSACLDSAGLYEQTYGYFECRCKLPAAQGLWSSFWLQSSRVGAGVPATEGMEIDVFESPLFARKSDNGIVTSNLHYNGYGPGHRFRNVGFYRVREPYTQFHTYGVEWNEKEYIFYIDGRRTGRSSFGGVSRREEYLLLSVEVDGTGGKPSAGWSGHIAKNAPGTLPVDFVVDHVRAYRYK